ncbi:HET-domain-containing protein [Viridothelium virens]|uniref:HET-domain-containing protein n=1 Tax=Viridothelium virens TaxID=1048519 RepID=A0A6A6GSP5_VIRVR|nr:HET-domain-containing protein [Viridothelium virens]
MDHDSSRIRPDDLSNRETGRESPGLVPQTGKIGKDEDCPVCHKLSLPSQKGDPFQGPFKLIETTVLEWSKVARQNRCLICPRAWKAFESFPPPEGWPPKNEKVQVKFRAPAKNCMLFGFVRHEGESHEDFNDAYTITSQAVADQEHTIEIYRSIPESHISFKEEGGQVWRSVSRDASSDEAVQVILNWFGKCWHNHESCKINIEMLLPDRVVYIADERTDQVYLEDGLSRKEWYIALSYCWGSGPTGIRTTKASMLDHKDQGLPIDDLPPTIRDTVRLAQKLGIQYLWIDRLCIVQDDLEDWAVQASKMCDVYANAVLCISADNAQGVWEGLFQPKAYAEEPEKDEVTHDGWVLRPAQEHEGLFSYENEKDFPTARRAWTFQEREMSRRMLRFTPKELIWQCNSLLQCELHEFASRSLTYQEDRLPALSGLATGFQRILEKKGNAQDKYLAGLWKNDFAQQLCWLPPTKAESDAWQRNNTFANPMPSVPEGDQLLAAIDAERRKPPNWDERRPETYVAPTWSWASINGPLGYFRCHPPRPFLSKIDLLTARIEPLESSHIYGRLKPGSGAITVQGHVSSHLKLKIFRLVFGPKDQDNDSHQNTMKTIFLLSDGCGSCIEIEPDDPVEIARADSQDLQALKCLLVGSVECPIEENTAVQNFDGPDQFAKVNENNNQRDESAPDNSEALGLEPELSSIFDPQVEDMNVFSFFLLLAPVSNQSGLFERLGCFQAGMNPHRVAVMRKIFMQSQKETVTIL